MITRGTKLDINVNMQGKRTFIFVVQVAKEYNLRNYLIDYCGVSKKIIREAHLQGDILVSGNARFLNQQVFNDEVITLKYQWIGESTVEPEVIPLTIVYEDSDILVVDKPAQMVVHPTLGYPNGTLANGIAYYYQQIGLKEPIRIINRLDKNTTGLVLIVKNEMVYNLLSQQFQNGLGHKKYLALVEGQVKQEVGVIDKPIGRTPDSIIQRRVTPAGKSAVTNFRRILTLDNMTLLELELETGRTHQIRVHLSHMGHPIVADDLYGGQIRQSLTRQALHVFYLSFQKPFTKEIIQLYSQLPIDMRLLIKA